MRNRPTRTLRLAALIAAGLAALLLSGCSLTGRRIYPGVTQDQLSAGVEPYFNVGGVTYQIQDSRQLNPFSDDVEYFGGLKNAQSIPASKFWYGVFLWAKNQNKTTRTSAAKFVLTDSAGNSYSPTTLNPKLNQFAWTSQSLGQDQIEPDPDSVAASGTTNGELILFELPYAAYQNRPLTLHIYGAGATTADSVSLDF